MPKGMLLAAGRGTRLGPLTEQMPKPLLPVANAPVMAQGIAALRQAGVTQVCSNVSYRAQQILDTFTDGTAHDITLHWSVESAPTGTAGGMKTMQSVLGDDTVIVIAGDAMLDIDLRPLLAAHRAHGAFVTLATVPVLDPSCYGVVVTDTRGRVVRFQEKPAPGTEISRQANTGIYIFDPGIFDLIPAGKFCDFALNVFPEILRCGLPFYAITVEGYWTDIGNPGDYLKANLDYLDGRIRVPGQGQRVGSSLLGESARVEGCRLTHCVVGDDVELAPGSVLTDCVVWPGTVVSTPLHLTGGILTPWGSYRVEGKEALPLEAVSVGV